MGGHVAVVSVRVKPDSDQSLTVGDVLLVAGDEENLYKKKKYKLPTIGIVGELCEPGLMKEKIYLLIRIKNNLSIFVIANALVIEIFDK